jgi:putative tryptophan/tyrosine transport system substrate-binding protein
VKRRDFITLLGGAAGWPLAARAQVTMVARIGFLRQAGPHEKQFNAFRDGLRAAGYVEGQNIVIEQRYAAGAYERLSGLASELVRCHRGGWNRSGEGL